MNQNKLLFVQTWGTTVVGTVNDEGICVRQTDAHACNTYTH